MVRNGLLFLAMLLSTTGIGATCRAQEEEKTYKIGVIMPLSGALADYGTSTLAGIEMATQGVNEAGGVGGKRIELVVENNEGDTGKSADAFRKLAGLNKVLAVIGPITSTNALAVTRDAQKKGVVLLTPTGTNDRITADGDFVFRTCFNDSFQGTAVAKFAVENLKAKTTVAFRDTMSDYSVGLCKSYSATFESLGGKVLPLQSYKTGDTDFTAQLRKIRRSGAETLFVPGYPPELPLIVNQARNMKLKIVLLGADGWDNDDLMTNSGENLQDTYFSAAFSTDVATPELEAFLAKAKARGLRNPGSFEALGYDSIGLVAQALKDASGAQAADLAGRRRAVRDALARVKDFKGATGSITMQESGDPVKSLVMIRFDFVDGKVKKSFEQAVNP